MKYHLAKKHSKATAAVVYKCKLLDKDFHGFYNLREHKRKEHGAQRGSGARNVDIAHVMVDVDENSLREELEKGKHFLVENQMKNGRHRAYNFAMDTLDPKYLLEKLDVVSDRLKCAAELNLAFGLLLKNVEEGFCR